MGLVEDEQSLTRTFTELHDQGIPEDVDLPSRIVVVQSDQADKRGFVRAAALHSLYQPLL